MIYLFIVISDPEELVVLLFEKVLQLDPFIKLRATENTVNKSLLYQIFPGELKKPHSTVQELLELSMFESGLLLDEVCLIARFPFKG